MIVFLTTLTTICLLFDIIEINATNDDDRLEEIFGERTTSDWERVWHLETHSRCRKKLVRHLFWACEKDIYRLTRRSDIDDEPVEKRSGPNHWIDRNTALMMLRTRRYRRGASSGGSITAECCTKIGCTWEEYAEYCPSNKRKNHYIV